MVRKGNRGIYFAVVVRAAFGAVGEVASSTISQPEILGSLILHHTAKGSGQQELTLRVLLQLVLRGPSVFASNCAVTVYFSALQTCLQRLNIRTLYVCLV